MFLRVVLLCLLQTSKVKSSLAKLMNDDRTVQSLNKGSNARKTKGELILHNGNMNLTQINENQDSIKITFPMMKK